MKSTFHKLLRIVGVTLLAGVFVFLGLKSCILTVWTYPDIPKKYEIIGNDGRCLAMIFLPSNHTLIHYKNLNNDETETVLTQMRGTFGTHYFGPIWKVEGPRITYGLRWVPQGGRPLIMETKYLHKIKLGSDSTNFPEVGETSHPEFIFAEGAIKWQGMWLTEVEPNQHEINELLLRFEEQENIVNAD